MDSFLKQLSSYNILNNLLPGAIFCFLLRYLCDVNLVANNFVEDLFVYYFYGMIISRIGSIIIEPSLKKMKFVKFANYGMYVEASKNDPKLEVLSETNNMYRTFIALFGLTLIIKIYMIFSINYIFLKDYSSEILIVSLLVLFAISYKKQVNYIKKRVSNNISNNNQ